IPAILYGIAASLAGVESVPQLPLSRVAGYRRSRWRGSDAQLFSSRHTLRIRHTIGLYSSSVTSISPVLMSNWGRQGESPCPLKHFGQCLSLHLSTLHDCKRVMPG